MRKRTYIGLQRDSAIAPDHRGDKQEVVDMTAGKKYLTPRKTRFAKYARNYLKRYA